MREFESDKQKQWRQVRFKENVHVNFGLTVRDREEKCRNKFKHKRASFTP